MNLQICLTRFDQAYHQFVMITKVIFILLKRYLLKGDIYSTVYLYDMRNDNDILNLPYYCSKIHRKNVDRRNMNYEKIMLIPIRFNSLKFPYWKNMTC